VAQLEVNCSPRVRLIGYGRHEVSMYQPSRILALSIAASLSFISAAFADPPPNLTGSVTMYTVESGDTWRSLASKFGVDPATLAAENHSVVSRPLTIGHEVRIDNRHIVPAEMEDGAITVNVPQRMLFFRDDAGMSSYPIAVGKGGEWRTP